MESQFVVDQVHSAFKADSSESTHALNHDVYSPSEIRSIFDSITYNKGASILRMLEKSYGKEMFYEALSDYLSKRYVCNRKYKTKCFFCKLKILFLSIKQN